MAWNGSNDKKAIKVVQTGKAPKPSVPLSKFAVTIFGVAIVSIVVFLCWPETHSEESLAIPTMPKATKATFQRNPVESTVSKPIVNESPPTPPKRMEDGVEVVSANITTNKSGAIIEKLTLANGKRLSKVHPPKPIFENASDQVIALALSVKPGQSMPPLPQLDKSLEQDFVNSLASPIVINDDDSEEIKRLKADVIETKAYIAEQIKNGGSLLEILREHQQMMNDTADHHLMAVEAAQKIKAEYGADAANEFIDRVNESLRAKGIPEIERGTTERRNNQ